MLFKLTTKIKKYKVASGAIFLVLIGIGYFGYTKIFNNDGVIRYATAKARKSTLVSSITGSGQVSALNQVDIKAKASGEALWVNVVNSQYVYAGAVIAQLDDRDAKKIVRDAQIALDQAKLELEKMKGLTTDRGNLRGVIEKAQDNLTKSYDDGFSTVADTFLALPDIMTSVHDILFSSAIQSTQWNINYFADSIKLYDKKSAVYQESASHGYQKARSSYDTAFSTYKNASRFSDGSAIELLITQAYDTVKNIAEALKNTNDLIQFYKDTLATEDIKSISLADTYLINLNGYIGKTNSLLLGLLSIKNSIQTNKEALVGTDFDIADQEIKVRQAENTRDTANEKLADYTIRAPFAGIIAKLNIKIADSVSNGTAIATLVTTQKIAEISLNEIDVAKIKVGQKVMLTFDAIPNLTITGDVAEVDAVGTVSQGVVTYTVKIGFDTQDDRVKTAMSVSAAIVTEAKPNALLVPNSAVKSQGGISYVEVPNEADMSSATANVSGAVFRNPTRQQQVEVGLSNDKFTEIVGGLQQGDVVVTRTIQPTATQTTQTQQNSSLRIPGLNTGGRGGGFRGGGSVPR